MKNKKEKIENWEERFWKILDNSEFCSPTPPCEVDWNKVYSFIRQEKAKDRRRFIKILEGLKQIDIYKANKKEVWLDRKVKQDWKKGYNQALKEVIKILKDEK